MLRCWEYRGSKSMNEIKLYDFQKNILADTKDKNKVAYYLDMGLGKTFVGAEKAMQYDNAILCVCQKSKIADWKEHFEKFYNRPVFDLTNKKSFANFCDNQNKNIVGVINYDILFRRPELSKLKALTLLLDESSLIANEKAKRSKFVLKKLDAENIILLSGTPTNGKYERLWSQLYLLGWTLNKTTYWNNYVNYHVDTSQGFPIVTIDGYKNVDRLKLKMREYGCRFLKTAEVFDLPEQRFVDVPVVKPAQYDKFIKNNIVTIDGLELIGDTALTKGLYARMLCGAYCSDKIEKLRTILESTENRIVLFYNYNAELDLILELCRNLNKSISVVNGKEKDLTAYNDADNSVTLVQYQSGAMGLNLQKASVMIFYTLPWGKGSCGLWEQAKKRIHRIGQHNTCMYYTLLCKNTIEEKNLDALKHGKELTDDLFKISVNT